MWFVSTEIAATIGESSYAIGAAATFSGRIGPTLGERSLTSAISEFFRKRHGNWRTL